MFQVNNCSKLYQLDFYSWPLQISAVLVASYFYLASFTVKQGRRQDFQKGGSALSIESPQRESGAVYTCKHVYSYKFIRNSE